MNILKILFISSLLAASATLQAGEGWATDFDKAMATAKAEGKPVLIDFTGSDWCGWCIKLDKEVFSKPQFKKYAEESLVLMMADFPRNKKIDPKTLAQNEKLAEKYEIRGFPTIVLLSPEGKLIGKTGYQPGGPEKYVEHLKAMIGEKSS